VHHIPEHIGVGATRHAVEERAGPHLTPVRHTGGFEQLRRPRHHVWLVEENPPHRLVPSEDRRQERTAASADVRDHVKDPEVVRVERRPSGGG
jgi:hypothetical protein